MSLLLILAVDAALVLLALSIHWVAEWRDGRKYCHKPGRGWYCTYAKGHLGECDAWPEWWMTLWVRLIWRRTP